MNQNIPIVIPSYQPDEMLISTCTGLINAGLGNLVVVNDGSMEECNKYFEKLKNECLDCTECPLRQGARQVVFGVGNENARIMFVGEGPGEQEDIQGEKWGRKPL